MSGATEEVNVKLIKFGGTDGIEADVMIDTTTYKIKVSQDEIDAAVEKGVVKSETNVPVGVNPYIHGKPTDLINGMTPGYDDDLNLLNYQEIVDIKKLSSYLNEYKALYETDLANYKKMKGGSNETVNTDSNDLSIPLSIALAVLKNQLETASSSNNSTEDKTAKVKELELILGFLERNIEEVQGYLNNPNKSNEAYDHVGNVIKHTNKSIQGITEFEDTYNYGQSVLDDYIYPEF